MTARPKAYSLPPPSILPCARMLIDAEKPASSPAHAREPGAGRDHRRGTGRPRDRCPPSSEPRCRRPWVEPARPGHVLPPILEHVHECVPHFSGRCEPAGVAAVTPYRPATTERTVHSLRYPDGKPPGCHAEGRGARPPPRGDECGRLGR